MKVAFATIFDGQDIRRGSGTFYHMSREIMRQGHTVHYVGPITFAYPFISRILRYSHRKLGWRYVTFLDPFVAKYTGQQITEMLATLDYDILLTNDFAIAGHTRTDKPIVLYTDAMLTYDYAERNLRHSRLSGLSPISLFLCRQTIQRGLEQSTLCFFPADWAVSEALKYHPAPEKIIINPFGANMDDPGANVADRRTFARILKKGRIDLLFVGKDWARKGGDIAVQTSLELRRRGIEAHLHLVGAMPPYAVDASYIKVYGLLDKADEADQKKLGDLYSSADVFILPSSSEGFVIVVLEAAAHGLPVWAYDTIGVTTAVRNNESGILLPLGQSEQAFADVVESWFSDPLAYDYLVAGARQHYENTTNWNTSVTKLMSRVAHLPDCNEIWQSHPMEKDHD
jgi:glycosyltransferase involved in cell wall biosynthesis